MKQFLNYQDQILKLRSKGLIVSDEAKAIEKLKQTSYFALINGYKKAFKSNNGNYIIGTRFEHIVSLYDFDIKLSELFLKIFLSLSVELSPIFHIIFRKNILTLIMIILMY